MVWIVEGKSGLRSAAERMVSPVISIPEVESWRMVLPKLIALSPRGGQVVIVLNADRQDDLTARAASWELVQACLALSYHVEVAKWDRHREEAKEEPEDRTTPSLFQPSEFMMPAWPHNLRSRVLATITPHTAPRTLGLGEMMTHLEDELTETFR